MAFGTAASIPVLLYFAATRRWLSPVLLGTYTFWILLWLAFVLEPMWLLRILDVVREAGIFGFMAGAAVLLACFSKAGAIGQEGPRGAVLLASGSMIAAILLGLIPGFAFRGDETRAIVWPSIALYGLQWLLAWGVREFGRTPGN
jgi:hypothetical protein